MLNTNISNQNSEVPMLSGKKIILVVSLFACFTLFAGAQDAKKDMPQDPKQEAVAAPNPNAPEITFETDVHDYGTVKQGADGGCEFKFTNTGKEPLIISNAVGSCGCTVPTWPKEPILKGQSAVISVHYDTKRVGGFTKNVTITSNAKTTTKVLTIKGTVEAAEQVDQAIPFKKDNGAAPLEMKSK